MPSWDINYFDSYNLVFRWLRTETIPLRLYTHIQARCSVDGLIYILYYLLLLCVCVFTQWKYRFSVTRRTPGAYFLCGGVPKKIDSFYTVYKQPTAIFNSVCVCFAIVLFRPPTSKKQHYAVSRYLVCGCGAVCIH